MPKVPDTVPDNRPEIRVAAGAADMDAVFAVRREVFIEEQHVPEPEEWDGRDADSVHLLAVGPGGEPLGTARLLPDGHLGRLAVRKPARSTGLGRALVLAVEAEARRRGMAELALDAQVYAIPFYERLGYTAHGGEFDDGSGIMHRAMTRTL